MNKVFAVHSLGYIECMDGCRDCGVYRTWMLFKFTSKVLQYIKVLMIMQLNLIAGASSSPPQPADGSLILCQHRHLIIASQTPLSNYTTV